MRKLSLFAIIALAIGITVFHSCKKNDELTNSENKTSETSAFNPNGINDMNAYLSDFIKNMKSPTKNNNTMTLEEAEWHLTACLNYQMCNANADKTDMVYDTIITKIHIDDNEISMSEINKSFVEISKNVNTIYNTYDNEEKQIVFIYSTIEHDNLSKGDANVRTIIASGDKNNHFYLTDWEFFCLDTLFPCSNEYLWSSAADSLEKYVTIIGTQNLNDDYYYVSIDSRLFKYNDYFLNPPIDINYNTFSNRLFLCGNCPYATTYLKGCDMVFYIDSYLGLAKRENTLQSGSFISAIVEAKIEENRELQGERIFHQLIATYGVPVINDDNNNPSN